MGLASCFIYCPTRTTKNGAIVSFLKAESTAVWDIDAVSASPNEEETNQCTLKNRGIKFFVIENKYYDENFRENPALKIVAL